MTQTERPEGREQQEVLPLSRALEAWERRDEAYGRMLNAAAAGDDVAYQRARADFWRQGK